MTIRECFDCLLGKDFVYVAAEEMNGKIRALLPSDETRLGEYSVDGYEAGITVDDEPILILTLSKPE